jgi:gluconate:H+ symporter, GntP family
MHPLAILLVAMAAVFLLIIRLRINAFVALISSAILIGVMAPDIPLSDVVREVSTRFGNVVGSIGIVIAMAAIIGHALMESGAADKITRRFVNMLGEKLSSLSMVFTGYVLSIPVFADTVFYLLIPLARAMSVRMGGRNYVLNALAISAGATSTHVFVPPTPGPLAMAATLQVDLGLVIMVGICVALPASFCGWLYSLWIDRRLNIPIREAPGLSLAELSTIATRPERELPPLAWSLMPILLPVALIGANTIVASAYPGTRLAVLMSFIGNPSLALLLAAVVAVGILAWQKRMSLKELAKPVEVAIKDAGLIILITAGGGAFGGMLQAAGVGRMLGDFSQDMGISLMVMGFLLASLFKLAQGSSTVCMITTSAILAPLLITSPPPYHPVYLVMAVGGGSLCGAWMNDSGFWVYRTMTGLNEVESLKTESTLLVVLGASGFLVALIGSWLVPLI